MREICTSGLMRGEAASYAPLLLDFDNFEEPTADILYPFNQLPRISAVGPNQLQSRTFASNFLEHQLGAVAVLEVRGMDHYRQQ